MTRRSVVLQPDELLTIVEAAERLRVSRWTIYRLIHRRELRTITIGSRRFVTEADVSLYISERRREASS